MAYTRRSEKVINIATGLFIGAVIAVGVLTYIFYNTKKLEVTSKPNIEAEKITEETIKEKNEQESNKNRTEFADDIRLQDYEMIKIPSNLKVGDFIDVRIKNTEGLDSIVLSKKEVVELANGAVWFQINKEERTLMNRAILELQKQKSILYSTTYLNPVKQKAATIDYKINITSTVEN